MHDERYAALVLHVKLGILTERYYRTRLDGKFGIDVDGALDGHSSTPYGCLVDGLRSVALHHRDIIFQIF
ncbi:MAG: hypothetical protein J6K83_07430 [Bacteroidaceae bacterium]|nr:hypothetical protein [Bacteroidaceae bacterium]